MFIKYIHIILKNIKVTILKGFVFTVNDVIGVLSLHYPKMQARL